MCSDCSVLGLSVAGGKAGWYVGSIWALARVVAAAALQCGGMGINTVVICWAGWAGWQIERQG